MTRTIDLLEVRDLVRDIALDNPDKIASAYYVVNDQPHCIVGVLLASLGWPLSNLQRAENRTALGVTATSEVRIGVTFTALARAFLSEVQFWQDAEWPWLQSYFKACETFSEQIEDALIAQANTAREAV